MNRYARIAAQLALWSFVATGAIFGALPAAETIGFSHRTHPLAWLGATGMPGAGYFNLFGFGLSGALAAFALWPLRGALPEGSAWSARIGAQLVMLSAVAFAAQAVAPIDIEDLDGMASGLHGTVWTLWWLAFGAGSALLAWGSRRGRTGGMREPAFALALLVPMCALFAQAAIPVALAQRLAFLLWLIWIAWISSRYQRWRSAARALNRA